MKHAIAVILSSLLTFVLLSGHRTHAEEQSLKDRFEKEGIASWIRHHQELDGWEGKITQRSTQQMAGRDSFNWTQEIEYSRRGLLGKSETRSLSHPDRPAHINCRNESYRFSLERTNPQGNLRVISYDPIKNNSDADDNFDYESSLLFQTFRLGGFLLPTALKNGLHVVEARPEKYKGRDLVRIRLEWAPRGDAARRSAASSRLASPAQQQEFWAIVDPADKWIVYESHMKAPWGEWSQMNEYRHLETGLPFPEKIHQVHVFDQGKSRMEMDLTFDMPTRCQAPPSAFHLSGFGLREARNWKAAYGRADWRMWLVVNAALLAIIGGLFFLSERIRRL